MNRNLMIVALAGLGMASAASADVSLQSNNATVSPAAVYQPGATGIGTFSWFNAANLSNNTIPYSTNISSGAVNGNLLTDGTFSSGSNGYISPNNVSPLRSFLWGFRPTNGSTNGSSLGGTAGGIGTMTISPTTIAQGTSSATINFSNIQLGATSGPTYQFSVANNISVARPGVGQAFVSNSITVTNTSTFATQNLQFFLMVDSQILGLGTGGNDRFGAATGSLVGSTRVIQFQDVGVTNPGSGGGAYTVNFGADNAGAWEAGTETTAGSNIRTRLASSTNGTTNALSNSISYTTGDPFGGYTWNVSLAPGASATFTGYIGVNTAVPTPGAMALMGLGGLAVARRRRR
jgi:MYXO-CTERM domain-containing protein